MGSRAPGDWGGLLIIGNGIINRAPPVLTEGPQGVTETYSGGTDNTDDSGTLRYVRIEFAGYDVSGGAGQELNSLSIYAVGSGTTLEYVQTLAGLDDGFEWWGGAVDGRYLVSYESGDEHFDWTEGFRGRNQFVIGFQSVRLDPAAGAGVLASDPEGIEADGCNGDGCDPGFAATPFSIPVFANFTLIGPGTATTPSASGDVGMVLRRGTGGYLTNGIVARWQSQGLSVRDAETDALLDGRLAQPVQHPARRERRELRRGWRQQLRRRGGFRGVQPRAGCRHGGLPVHQPRLRRRSTGRRRRALPRTTGAGTVVIPTEYTGNYFGGTLANTTYFGAADPAGPKWWEGWTNYATE